MSNSTPITQQTGWEGLQNAIEAAAMHERAINQIMILAVEYEAKTITAERFASRIVEILVTTYKPLLNK